MARYQLPRKKGRLTRFGLVAVKHDGREVPKTLPGRRRIQIFETYSARTHTKVDDCENLPNAR